MKLKVYLLRVVVAFAAFVLGISLFGASRYLKSFFETKKPEVVTIQPAPKQETVCALPVAATVEPVAEPENVSEWEFDGTAEYFIAGKVPKEFKDFSIMSIAAIDYENTSDEYPNGSPIPPEGFVQAARKHKFARISIANKQLAFETETKNGIRYKFTGTFLDQEKWEYDDNIEASVVLEGSLTKLRDGKKIAKSKVRFAFDNSCGC